MLGSIWNFIKRHKRKFLWTGAVVGGVILLGKYAGKKLQEIQEVEAAECLAHARRQHHFDSNQRTCNVTVLSMLPSLREALMQALDSEALTAQLKTKPTNKVDLWEQLKIVSFTRTLVAVYSCSMLIVLLRVQLNIIGGYMYLDNAAGQNTAVPGNTHKPDTSIIATSDVQQKYLAGVQYLLGQGLTELIRDVQEAVQQVLSRMSLKTQLSLAQVGELISQVRKQIEYREHSGYHDASITSLCHYMLPQDTKEAQACSLTQEEVMLARLTQETKDMLESNDFHSVLGTCLDTGFTRLMDRISEYFHPSPEHSTETFHPNHLAMPLAKLIPVVNGLIHTICGDAPNQFIQELLLKDQVQDFAANVYEAFSQPHTDQAPYRP